MRSLSIKDRLLDATVVWSFDASGFRRHARRFDPADLDVDLSGRRIAVTGANSGIGKATATGLVARGAHVLMLCRSPERGAAAQEEVDAAGPGTAELVVVDVSSRPSIDAAIDALGSEPLHALLHNAGVLPSERRRAETGHELTVATHLVGPLRLTAGLRPALESARGRLLWVTSGGMYPTKLSVAGLQDLTSSTGAYDGVAAYSLTKRAQTVLTEQLAERLPSLSVHVMHPGWADTPAVASSIPKVHEMMEKRLRRPEQGADTLLWLAAADAPTKSTGQLWFDRRPVATHYLPWTKASASERASFWDWVTTEADVRF